MKRYVSLEEISDGRLYGANDMVKADCGDCAGCSACCRGMGNTIILDPFDVFRLAAELGKSCAELLAGPLEWNVVDGLILPNLKMVGEEGKEHCSFLDGNGRCSVHNARPGICRLFPLGRYYENKTMHYFLQVGECRKERPGKIKVWKWIDTPGLKEYERFVVAWHYFLERCAKAAKGDEAAKRVNLYLMKLFYLQEYGEEEGFYQQFYGRLEEAEAWIAAQRAEGMD